MKLIFLLDILIITVLEYIGDSHLKGYARKGGLFNLAIGVITYLIAVGFLVKILGYTNVMYMNVSWDAMSVIVETLLAYIFLKESLSNNVQWAGLVFIVIGMILLNYGKLPV